jgi:hypothetical protein
MIKEIYYKMSEVISTKKVYENNVLEIYLDTYEETSNTSGVYGYRTIYKDEETDEED